MAFWKRSTWQGPPPRSAPPARPAVEVVPPPLEESLCGPAAQRRRAMERGLVTRSQVQRMVERDAAPGPRRAPSAVYDATGGRAPGAVHLAPAGTPPPGVDKVELLVRIDLGKVIAEVAAALARLSDATRAATGTMHQLSFDFGPGRRSRRRKASPSSTFVRRENLGVQAAARRRMATAQHRSARRAARRARRAGGRS